MRQRLGTSELLTRLNASPTPPGSLLCGTIFSVPDQSHTISVTGYSGIMTNLTRRQMFVAFDTPTATDNEVDLVRSGIVFTARLLISAHERDVDLVNLLCARLKYSYIRKHCRFHGR
ncbi:hypothetical protein KC360_g71 [Hortaea werneckii]|nr:hypothetical protein KC360_g71 [Hortaea werneckii]